jgi:hypothetical protein
MGGTDSGWKGPMTGTAGAAAAPYELMFENVLT